MVHLPLYILSIFMSIIKPSIRTKINSILALRSMEQNGDETETDGGTPEEGEGAIYTNSPPGGGSFEDRFSFQHKDLLPPPPVPTKATLERRNMTGTMTGTKPKIKIQQSSH